MKKTWSIVKVLTFALFLGIMMISCCEKVELEISPTNATLVIGQYCGMEGVGTWTKGGTIMIEGVNDWESSNPEIVTVNRTTGVAQAKSVGSAEIEAFYRGVSKKCNINVTDQGYICFDSNDTIYVQAGDTAQFSFEASNGLTPHVEDEYYCTLGSIWIDNSTIISGSIGSGVVNTITTMKIFGKNEGNTNLRLSNDIVHINERVPIRVLWHE